MILRYDATKRICEARCDVLHLAHGIGDREAAMRHALEQLALNYRGCRSCAKFAELSPLEQAAFLLSEVDA